MNLSPDISDLFWNAFRKDAFQLIAWGYTDIHGIITPDDEETYITGDLTNAIANRLKQGNLPDRFDRYDAQEEVYVTIDGKRGKNRPRLDIVVKTTGKTRFEYIFEAKRLKTNGYSIGKYIGEDGVGCYTSSRYAEDMHEAGMIAYIQNKDVAYWTDQLSSKLDVELNTEDIINELPVTYKSQHLREENSPIDIFHIFLDLTREQ